MLFYTCDEATIFGISRNIRNNSEAECLKLMKEYLNSEIGYITYEEPPYNIYEEVLKKIF